MKIPAGRGWWMRHAVPVVVLLGSLMILGLFFDDPDMIWMLVAIPLAIGLGYVFRPERVWVIPLAVAMIIATTIVIGALFGNLEPNTSPLLNIYPLVVLTIGGPLLVLTWIGKMIRLVVDDWRRTHRGSTMAHR